MRVDLKVGTASGTLKDILQTGATELGNLPTAATDDVVMVGGDFALRELIDGRAIIQHHLADYAKVSHQLDRPEDRRPSGGRSTGLHLFGSEVITRQAHRVHYRLPGGREPVATALHSDLDQRGIIHLSIVPRRL